MELLKVADLEDIMSCGCSNHVESKIDRLSIGPGRMFHQNLRMLRNVLNMSFTFNVDFDGWSMTTADSSPPSVYSIGSSLYVVEKSTGSPPLVSETPVYSN